MANVVMFQCTICRDGLYAPTPARRAYRFSDIVTTQCGHLFHNDCLTEWLYDSNRAQQRPCPICERRVMPSDLIQLYPEPSPDGEVLNTLRHEIEKKDAEIAGYRIMLWVLFSITVILLYVLLNDMKHPE